MVLKNSLLVAFSIFRYFYFFQNKLNHESIIDSVVLVSDFQKKLGCKSDFSPDCEITRFKKSEGLWNLSMLVLAGDRDNRWVLASYVNIKVAGLDKIKWIANPSSLPFCPYIRLLWTTLSSGGGGFVGGAACALPAFQNQGESKKINESSSNNK